MCLLNAKKRVEARTNLILFEWNAAQCEINLLATIVGDELVYHEAEQAMEGRKK